MVDHAALFEASPNPYMVLDRELRYVAANHAYCEAVGQPCERLIGRRIFDVFPHDPADPSNESARRLEASFARVLETGEPDVLPLLHYRIDVDGRATDRYWSATHTPLYDRDGRVELILQHTVDVTALHAGTPDGMPHTTAGILDRAQTAAERTEQLLSDLGHLLDVFEQAPVFLCLLHGPDHVIELANQGYRELVGGRALIGRRVRDAFPDLEADWHALLDDVFTTGKPFVGRRMRLELDRGGTRDEIVIDFVYQPLRDDRGLTAGILVVGNDVTQHVRAEAERESLFRQAQQARAEAEAILEAFPEALFVGDATGVKRANAAARAVLGYETVAELKRAHRTLVGELVPRTPSGELLEPSETPFGKAVRGIANRSEVVIRHRHGGDRRMFASGAPIRVGDAVTGAVVTMIDVTEQRRAQLQVEQLAKVLDAAPDFVGISTPDGTPTFVNAAGLALVGLPDLEAARGVPVVDYFVERQRDLVAREVLPAVLSERGQWAGELVFLHRQTGEEIPVLYSGFSLRDASGAITAVATITRDLRGQKAADVERAHLLEAERHAREQAEQANILKDQFLAIVSHELRTPLAAILGWMHLLRSEMLPAERRERALETVERNARIQAQLIEDLLDVSRIMSGKLELERVPTDVAAFVGAGVDTIRPTAEAKGVRLEVVHDFVGQVLGDSHRLQQVVWNLVSNAVKFTPRDGTVTLHVRRENGSVAISIRDTGAGIPRQFLPHVFEQFRQAEGHTARKLGGLGLGLSIVKHVVTAHAGTVTAESDGPGTGATFTVRLPIAVARDRALPATPDAIEPPAAIAGIHVLVVDDDDDTREYVRMLLDNCHARVSTASNAADAFDLLVREQPDVLVSDIGMPEQDGYQLIRKVRALPGDRGGRTPAVALTAFASMQDRTRAMLAGYHNHVTKPIEPTELLAAVAALAGHR